MFNQVLRKMQLLVCILQLINSLLLGFLVLVSPYSLSYSNEVIVVFCVCITMYTFSGMSALLAFLTDMPSFIEVACVITILCGMVAPGALYNYIADLKITYIIEGETIITYITILTIYNIIVSFLYYTRISAGSKIKAYEPDQEDEFALFSY